MTLKFGTDGIRGVANVELTPELSLALGRAAASVFGGGRRAFVVGRDTRRSGPALQAALSAGLASAGCDVIDVGVLPTPAVAYLSALRDAPAAMISASHNPFADNGIKFFLPGGRKLSDDVEATLEDRLHRFMESGPTEAERPGGEGVGVLSSDGAAAGAYNRHLIDAIGGGSLSGLKVVLDCANGAATGVAPDVFTRVGVEVVVINASPDGRNINDNCGSTHPQSLQAAVVAEGADAGLAFDGDADRVLAVDERGALVDGDEIMGMLAIDAKSNGTLKDDTLVLTVMSNLGLRLSMERHGIRVEETAVGDRYVLEALTAGGWSLGGEQSGHIIFPALASTGDGLLTGLKVLSLMKRSGRPLSALSAAAMRRLPQVLRNVRVKDRHALDTAPEIADAVRAVEAEFGDKGRVLLRASGTEPLIRVMVEAPTQEAAEAACARLCDAVESVLGAG